MDIKMIASDLDGTLMYSDHLTVTPYTRQTLLAAHEKGIKLAIATGRPLALIDSVLEQIPFVDYIIYANGACVYDKAQNRAVFSSLIEAETTKKILSYFLKEKVFFEIYVDGKSHYQAGSEDYYNKAELPEKFREEVFGTMTAESDLLAFAGDRPIEKLTMYSIRDEVFAAYADKLRSYGLAVATSLKHSLEATAPDADKGHALRGVCQTLGILPSQTMSFGDAGNDCTMLEWADHSFAMENASTECKAHAKHITASNAEDGVAKAIAAYCL